MAEADKTDVKQDVKEDASDDADKQQDKSDVKTEEGPKTLEEAKALLTKQTQELASNADLLKKVRKFEKENKEKADTALKEQGKYKELYEAELSQRVTLETKWKDSVVNGSIESVLKEMKVPAVTTVMKLIDRSKVVIEDGKVDTKSIQSQLDALKVSDPVLFGPATKVDVKRPGEHEPTSGFATEIRAARSQKEIEAIGRKYGVLK